MAHLFRRFFDVATARGLTGPERASVSGWLTPETAELFFAQSNADQRHGYRAALTVIDGGACDDVVMAALLHDVGKRHARLGVVARSIAALLISARLPLSARMATYRDHGLVAARELAALSLPPLVADFAAHHHGERPASIESETWDLLISADQPPKASSSLTGWITSNGT